MYNAAAAAKGPGLLAEFAQKVPKSGYRIVEAPWGTALAAKDISGPVRAIYPFSKDRATLYRTFADLPLTDKAVLEFAESYGSLGRPIQLPWSPDGDPGKVVEAIQLRGVRRRTDDCPKKEYTWLAQIRLMRRFLTFTEGNPDPYPETLRQRVAAIFAQTCGPTLEWPDQPGAVEVREAVLPHGLLGALWIQAFRSTGKRTLRACEMCGKSFEISRDAITGKRSHSKWCGYACAMKAQRQREKRGGQLIDKGWTNGKIAKTVGSDPKTVQRWRTKRRQRGKP